MIVIITNKFKLLINQSLRTSYIFLFFFSLLTRGWFDFCSFSPIYCCKHGRPVVEKITMHQILSTLFLFKRMKNTGTDTCYIMKVVKYYVGVLSNQSRQSLIICRHEILFVVFFPFRTSN